MTTATIPTSGSARRRAKAARNRQLALNCEAKWAFLNDRIPPHAIAASVCSCGYRSWLMPGANDEDWESFERDNDDHATYCESA
jgi:hypothetical protein